MQRLRVCPSLVVLCSKNRAEWYQTTIWCLLRPKSLQTILSFCSRGSGKKTTPRLQGLISIRAPHLHLLQPHTLAHAPAHRFYVAIPHSPLVDVAPSAHAPVLLVSCYPFVCATHRSRPPLPCCSGARLASVLCSSRGRVAKDPDGWRSNSSPGGGIGAVRPWMKHRASSALRLRQSYSGWIWGRLLPKRPYVRWCTRFRQWQKGW